MAVRAGHRQGGPGAVQHRPGGGPGHVVPEREHLPGPSVGPGAGDPRRGPRRGKPLRRRLRPGPSGQRQQLPVGAAVCAADLGLLQARHGLRPRGLGRRAALQLRGPRHGAGPRGHLQPAVPELRRRRRRHLRHVRLYGRQRRPVVRRRRPSHGHRPRRLGTRRLRRLGLRRRGHHARRPALRRLAGGRRRRRAQGRCVSFVDDDLLPPLLVSTVRSSA